MCDADLAPPVPLFRQIRLLDTVDATVGFIRRLESVGVDAVAVHLRKTDEAVEAVEARWALPDITALASCVSIPVVFNGDVGLRQIWSEGHPLCHPSGGPLTGESPLPPSSSPPEVEPWCRISVMVGRAALRDATIFR